MSRRKQKLDFLFYIFMLESYIHKMIGFSIFIFLKFNIQFNLRYVGYSNITTKFLELIYSVHIMRIIRSHSLRVIVID